MVQNIYGIPINVSCLKEHALSKCLKVFKEVNIDVNNVKQFDE